MNRKQYIRAIVKAPHCSPAYRMVCNELRDLQDIVNGFIECYHTTIHDKPVVIICNEEGRLNGMQPNCILGGELFVGPIIIVGMDGDEFDDVPINYLQLKATNPELWRKEK